MSRGRLLQDWKEAHARALAYGTALGIGEDGREAIADAAVAQALEGEWSAEADALALIEKYQRRKVAVSLEPGEQEEAIVLCERYQALYSAFPPGTAVEFTPQIRGAGFVDSCEGDIAISNCLVEVKTTNRKPSSKDLRQVFIYIALDLNAGNDRWTEFAIFNPRRCTLHRAAIEPLTFRLSGGRPLIDVVSDLISFVESNEIIANDQF